MANNYARKSLVLINVETGERKNMESINAAARFLGSIFRNVQNAALYNGVVKGWRIYEDAKTIKAHIAALQEQLKVVEGK